MQIIQHKEESMKKSNSKTIFFFWENYSERKFLSEKNAKKKFILKKNKQLKTFKYYIVYCNIIHFT